VKEDSERGQSLLGLLRNCCSGAILELSSADPDEAEMYFWQRAEPKMKVKYCTYLTTRISTMNDVCCLHKC